MSYIKKDWERKDALLKRFGLEDCMWFKDPLLRNVTWQMDGFTFGFGDLRDVDIFRIKYELKNGEVFACLDWHHGGPYQMRTNPVCIITHSRVSYPKPEGVPDGR